MHTYRADRVLSSQGWLREASITVSDAGEILALSTELPAANAERIEGIVVPGMPNAHSHAFQRAMAGATEVRTAERASFWTWRTKMYALANSIGPDDLELIATQLFVEMLKAGYTSVAEFHYLHRAPDGAGYDGSNALWQALDAAAHTAGIGLTLLPTLYLSSDFGAQALRREQARFQLSVDEFLEAIERRRQELSRSGDPRLYTGAAFHSLRAVPIVSLRAAAAGLQAISPGGVIHIHVAEQMREVRACIRSTGRRPIELLLDTGLIGPNWCLVHATHANAAELDGITAHGAIVCLCPSTEGNLGDGWFDAARLLNNGGTLCIGSDSQASVCPAEELRWLEYQQRLKRHRRAVLATDAEPHVGARLWGAAARGGALALGQPVGVIEVGRRADWLVLDPKHPALAGAAAENVLDHLVFAGARAAIRDVMVAGRWVVRGGCHDAEKAIATRFGSWMKQKSFN